MDIKGNSLLAEMNSLASLASQDVNTRNAIPASSTVTSGNDFSSLLKSALDNVNQLGLEASEMRTRFEMGDSNVSLAETMITAQKGSIAFEATVQVRNKMVEAYKEIMNMPV